MYQDPDIAHLKNKIEVVYKCNPCYVPEFSTIHQYQSIEELRALYELVLSRAHEDNGGHENLFNIMLFFNAFETRPYDPSTIVISEFILAAVKDRIKGHVDAFSKLTERNSIEEECFVISQQIISLEKCRTGQFLPLFKKYLLLLIEHKNKNIRIPLFSEFTHDQSEDIFLTMINKNYCSIL